MDKSNEKATTRDPKEEEKLINFLEIPMGHIETVCNWLEIARKSKEKLYDLIEKISIKDIEKVCGIVKGFILEIPNFPPNYREWEKSELKEQIFGNTKDSESSEDEKCHEKKI
jgi:predicted metal-dependent RNase